MDIEARRQLAERTLGKVRPHSITYESAKELFLAEKRKSRRPRTVESLETRLHRHFPFKGQLSEIKHQDIARRLTRIKSNSEHDHALAVAKTFFTWVHNRRYIDDNPTRGLSPHGSQARSCVLTDEELYLIWRACEQTGDDKARAVHPVSTLTHRVMNLPSKDDVELPRLPAHFATIVKLLILTGQRRGEIAALRANYFKDDLCTLPNTLTKNKRDHTFPLGRLSSNLLTHLLTPSTPPSSLLFQARANTNSCFNGWSKAKTQLDKLSGVKDWTLHDLRRTFGGEA